MHVIVYIFTVTTEYLVFQLLLTVWNVAEASKPVRKSLHIHCETNLCQMYEIGAFQLK